MFHLRSNVGNKAPSPNPPGNDPAVGPTPMPRAPKNPFKLLNYLRTYDGTTGSSEYLRRLQTDVDLYDIPLRWMIANLDRLLEGQALSWYNSMYPYYALRLNGNEEQDNAVWNDIKTDFNNVFGTKASTLKDLNCPIWKDDIQDPHQLYVTNKIAALLRIDHRMSETIKIENLIQGLPHHLQLYFASNSVTTLFDFLQQLKRISEVPFPCNRQPMTWQTLYNSSNPIPKTSEKPAPIPLMEITFTPEEVASFEAILAQRKRSSSSPQKTCFVREHRF